MKNVLLFLILFLVFEAHAQYSRFQLYTGDTVLTGFNSEKEINGNFFLIGGTNLYSSDKKHDCILIKMNKYENIIWSKIYGYNNNEKDVGNYVIQTKDNGLLICSSIIYYSPTALNLIKTDSNGNIMWSKRYDQMEVRQIIEVSDSSGYLILGNGGKQNLYNQYKNRDILIMKVDLNGNLLWSRIYGGGGEDWSPSGIIQSDGSIVVCGSSSYSKRFDAYIIKVNSNGQLLWSRTYILKDYVSNAWGITKLRDGGYAIIVMPQQNKNYQLILKVDSVGMPVWNKLYHTSDDNIWATIGGGIYENVNGDLISVGQLFISNNNFTPTLLCTDKEGNVKWQRHYDHFDSDISMQIYSFSLVSDGYLLSGNTYSTSKNNENMYIIKTDTLGFTGCSNDKTIDTWTGNVAVQVSSQDTNEVYNVTVTDYPIQVKDTMPVFYSVCGDVGINDNEELKMKNEELSIYPNPAKNYIFIDSDEPIVNIEIYNVFGEQLLSKRITDRTSQTLDITGFSKGIYLVRAVNTKGEIYITKFVKE